MDIARCEWHQKPLKGQTENQAGCVIIFINAPLFSRCMKEIKQKRKITLEPVKDISIENQSFSSMAAQMCDAGGFSSKKVGLGVNILAEFLPKKDCLRFLSL